MSLDRPKDDSDPAQEEQSSIFQYAVNSFNRGSRLDHDSINVWNGLAYVTPKVPRTLERVKPLRHYEEYVRSIDQSHNEGGKYAGLIMQRSNPESVAAFDRLVDEFNADVERIKREKDYETITRFVSLAKELVFSTD